MSGVTGAVPPDAASETGPVESSAPLAPAVRFVELPPPEGVEGGARRGEHARHAGPSGGCS